MLPYHLIELPGVCYIAKHDEYTYFTTKQASEKCRLYQRATQARPHLRDEVQTYLHDGLIGVFELYTFHAE
jgi:hypothetical protein